MEFDPAQHSMFRYSKGQGSFLLLEVVVAIVTFCIGVFAPFLTLKEFFFFNNTVSLYSSLLQLFKEDEFFLFTIITVFSVLFPLIKLILILFSIFFLSTNRGHRLLIPMERIGKWSMLDVFVVAIIVASIKFGNMASVQVHYGVYAFAISVILTKVIIWHSGKIYSKAVENS
tara:strand:+ start:1430 stop:1945 length:516 start_codon:yes stop_codon:yes gene_type:complete